MKKRSRAAVQRRTIQWPWANNHLKKQWLQWRETGRSPGGLSKEKGWCVVGDLSRSEETTMSLGGLFQVTTQKGALFTNPEVGGGAWLQTTKYEIGTILPKKAHLLHCLIPQAPRINSVTVIKSYLTLREGACDYIMRVLWLQSHDSSPLAPQASQKGEAQPQQALSKVPERKGKGAS